MIETSSDLHRRLQQSSAILGNLRKFPKMLRNVRVPLGQPLKNLRKVVGNLRKFVKNDVFSMFKK